MPTALVPAAEARRDERSVPAGLISTKLRIPTTAPGYVARGRLVDRLAIGLEHGLVLVSAPAGAGKTALLAEWVARLERPVAWLSVDADDDPARYWQHLTAAIGRTLPERQLERASPARPSYAARMLSWASVTS